MEISQTRRVRNEVLHTINEERYILNTIKKRKANCIGQILRVNCRKKQAIEGQIGGRGVEVEDVISYWITLKKRKDAGN
jgi:hypothetical protein